MRKNMLKINNVKYENITPEIDFTPYELVREGNLNKVNALYITCEEKTFQLDIETTYDIEEMRKLHKNESKDISKYILGLPYEDINGWMYLTNECHCTIQKISSKFYNIKLTGNFEECNEILNIEFDHIFEIK